MKENKRTVWSWAFYDWANSAYSTTVMAGFFPLFFKEYWADSNNPNQSTFYLGMANSIASILVAAMAPLLGSVADQGSAKKKFLILFVFLGVIMTGGLWMVEQGNWPMAVLFYVMATIGFASGNIPSISTNYALIKGISLLGVRAGEYFRKFPDKKEPALNNLFKIANTGKITPFIYESHSLSKVIEALKKIEQRKVIGRIILKP